MLSAVKFTGSQYIAGPRPPSGAVTAPFTLEMMVTWNGSYVFLSGDSANRTMALAIYNANSFNLYLGDGSAILASGVFSSSVTIPTNTPFMLTVVVTTTALKVYIDAQLAATRTYTGTPLFTDATHVMNYCQYTPGGSLRLNGSIQEVRVFSAELSQATIAAYMHRSLSPNHPNYGSLFQYLQFTEGAGTSLADSSGNGNGCNIVGAGSSWVQGMDLAWSTATLLHVFGGISGTTNVNVHQVYNLETGTWGLLWRSPLSGPISCVRVGDLIYLLQWQRTAGPCLLYAYDPATGNYTQKASYPHANDHAQVVAEGNGFWVQGAYSESQRNDFYDASTDSWTSHVQVPAWHWRSAGGFIDGTIYFMGGQDGGNPANWPDCYAYEIVSDSWTWLTASPMPNIVGEAASIVVGDKLYVIGGDRVGVAYDYNQVFDPATGWSELASIPHAVSYTAQGAFGSHILVVGGGHLQDYDIDTDSWADLAAPLYNVLALGGSLPIVSATVALQGLVAVTTARVTTVKTRMGGS